MHVESDKAKSQSGTSQVNAGAKKNSTTQLPSVSLEQAIAFVQKIYEKALETALMSQVSKGVGYLYLDKERTKRVTFNCPLFLSQSEYDRICNWIKATWIIEKEKTQ
jgi:hypothetical protein